MIEFIDSNKNNYDIKAMYTVLGVARSTYYKSFDKTKTSRQIESEEFKIAIKRIYIDNKSIHGASRIHHIFSVEGFRVSLKRIQRLMNELGLVKKYKPNSSEKRTEVLENILKKGFYN